MHAFDLSTLFAQASSFPLAGALGGLVVLLGLAVAYLAAVALPMLRTSLDRAQNEREAALRQLDSQSADTLRRLNALRSDFAMQLADQERKAQGQIALLNEEVTQLRRCAAQQSAVAPQLQRELVDAKLAAHVNRGLSNRLGAELHAGKAHAEAHLDRLHGELAAANALATTSESKLQDARFDLHVRRGIQDRLETKIRRQDGLLLAARAEVAELRDQVDRVQNAIRAQSQAVLDSQLAAAEQTSARLRRLRDQLETTNGSPLELLQTMASAAIRPSHEAMSSEMPCEARA